MNNEQEPFEIKRVFNGSSDEAANYIMDVNSEVRRLRDKLAAVSKEPDWTNITDLQQVVSMKPGYYEVRHHGCTCNDTSILIKSPKKEMHLFCEDFSGEPMSVEDVKCSCRSYRLIHTFEKPEKKYQLEKASWTAKDIAEWHETNAAGPGSVVAGELARDLLEKQRENAEQQTEIASLQQRVRELEGE